MIGCINIHCELIKEEISSVKSIERLSRYLGDTFGKGFSEANLRNFRQFYLVIPDFSEFATQCVANLTWSNIRQIIRLDDAKERVLLLTSFPPKFSNKTHY
ncbi:MAG: DUF1016 N-terminal domain-containing protein [Planctomycetaceae bacterium]|jgi:hypothetical protein|nr:DUF1016 N-terminal domain-containing protein [Planctomycetaceae bacterium]